MARRSVLPWGRDHGLPFWGWSNVYVHGDGLDGANMKQIRVNTVTIQAINDALILIIREINEIKAEQKRLDAAIKVMSAQ